MSKCELLSKGCDCGSTEAAKCQQRERIESIMEADEKDGIYQLMRSREEIEEAISRMEAEIETGLDIFVESYYEAKIEALKWVLNEI